jgi:aminobenzoyl-glutamate utilization protein B
MEAFMRTGLISLLTRAALTITNGVLASNKDAMISYLDNATDKYGELALAIWDKAELGYLETESFALLQATLGAEGFSIKSGVAGIPAAFVASYGSGQPVIGLLTEFDALPGISQSASPVRNIPEGKTTGHACGHHLFGAGSTAAAIAVKQWMAANAETLKGIWGSVNYSVAEQKFADELTESLNLTGRVLCR